MNRFFILFFLTLGFATIQAQIHEIGVFLGSSNYIGEIGKTDYIAPNEGAFGIIYKWNRSQRHSWRFSYIQSKVTSNDKNASASARKLRGYDFENSIKEVSAGLEFDFFEFDLHDSKPAITPYVYTGLSFIKYNSLYFINGKTNYNTTDNAFSIPIIVGIKGRLFDNLVLGVEAGARSSFKDNIDGSNPKDKNLTLLQFGNINSNDWYVFTGFTITYTFGNKPCFCAQ